MVSIKVIVSLISILELTAAQELNTNTFPESFIFGVATASYQVEGAWNESDKSENIWDHLTHNYPELILDGSSGDVACDSYHHIDDDVGLMKNLGVQFYRFSISWSRLLPESYSNKISEDGLKYYNDLINALVAADIMPMITLYHWDLSNELQKLGGWVNPIIADYYSDYAQVAFENFGDRVKYWITFNEPSAFCSGYGSSDHAPVNIHNPGIGEYLCIHTMLKAHAKAYHIYDENYRSAQKGTIGITLAIGWNEPNSTAPEDAAAAFKAMQFGTGLYAHAIFSSDGDYPEIVKTTIANRSALEGFPYSRLPEFTEEEIQYIKGSADFLGMNHYTTVMAVASEDAPIGEPSLDNDISVTSWIDTVNWQGSAQSWLSVVPWGFRKVLLWLENEYGYPIYVTENGYPDLGGIDDDIRVNYYQTYLSALLEALDEGANVKGYTAWSLIDNFEWLDGYLTRFGLHYVNMSDPARPRTIKKSGEYYKQVISTRQLTATNSSNDDSDNNSSLSVVAFPLSLVLVLASILKLF